MSSRKYANDYRLENVSTRSGKLKTVAVYNGEGYVFSDKTDSFPRSRLMLALAAAAAWIAQLTALGLNTRCARCAWVVLPQAFSLLALGFLTVGVWMLFRARPPMSREYAEKTYNRINGGAVMSLILSGCALVGAITAVIVFRRELSLPSDIIYLALLAVATAACGIAVGFRACARIERLAQKTDSNQ